MPTKRNSHSRAAMRIAYALILALIMPLTVQATEFITDVMVIGNNDKTKFKNLQDSYVDEGWTAINKDLNAGCGDGSDYIHLLYKTTASEGSSGKPITGFYLKKGDNPPASLTDDGCTYYLVACDGSTNFKNSQGDLNRGAEGDYIHLYYTTDVAPRHPKVTGITFNDTQSGAVGKNGEGEGYDLNAGCGPGTDYIYMHVATYMVMLTSASADVELPDGIMLTGTGGANTHVTIADGATVTLSGVDITGITHDGNHPWAGITCLGDAIIILDEGTTNNVKGGYTSSGILVPEGKTLTIQGGGTLNATGNSKSAGIGSSNIGTCGNITINSGTIIAYGSDYAAGIGTGGGDMSRRIRASCGIITINGGTVTAYGSKDGAGIGCSWYSTCGNVTITGGIVTANGGKDGAGIGSSFESQCGNITISGGIVTANGGDYGAGIGSGYDGFCDNVTITTGITRVTATKGTFAPYSIGKGFSQLDASLDHNAHCGTVTIGGIETGFIEQTTFTTYPYTVSFNANGGKGTMDSITFMYGVAHCLPANNFSREGSYFKCWNTKSNGSGNSYAVGQAVSNLTTESEVTIYAQWFDGNLAEINTDFTAVNGMTLYGTLGANVKVSIADGATVTLSGVTINGTDNESYNWAGINCLGDATIILSGTNSVKGFHEDYPGIHIPKGSTLHIKGSGSLTATSNGDGAGIGGGDDIDCGNITISGGTITANGSEYSAGIGSGEDASCGNITISGGTVTANGGHDAAGIGSGFDGFCGNITICGGTVTANGGEYAVGIGNGYYGSCGNITFTKGVTRVTATKGSNGLNSIGGGIFNDIGTVTFGCTLDDSGNPVGGIVTGIISISPFTYDPTVNVIYTLSFDANGGTGTAMSSSNCLYGLEKVLPACTYRRTGYEFAGWSTTASGAVEYANRAAISTPTITNGGVTLYAKWTEYVLELTDNASNATTIATAAATYKTYNRVTLTGRTLYKDGDWNTLCLPLGLTAEQVTAQLAPAKLMTLSSSSFSGGALTLNFADATSIDAGKPYIIKWEKPTGYDGHESDYDITNPVFTGVTISNTTANVETDHVDFIGTYSPEVIYESGDEKHNLYLGDASTLSYPTAEGFMVNAFRGYFQLKGLTAGTTSANARAFVLNFGDGDATGVEASPYPSPEGKGTASPLLQEGTGEAFYDLTGRRLDGIPTTPGLYIVNGKKIYVK